MKKKLIIPVLIICLCLPCFSFTACQKEMKQYSAHSFDYFDTVTTISGYAESQAAFDAISADILAELAEYHKLFTIYHRYEGLENLCTINELTEGVHRTVKVDRRIIEMLLYAKEMYRLTDGNVNVAMGSVLSIWHDYRTVGSSDPVAAQLPPMEKLLEAAEHTDINNLVIDENASTVTITDSRMKLDVGAIAKGYAVEMVARSMESKGITGYVLNVGGNVRTVGVKNNGEKWTVGIENPLDVEEEPYLAYLSLSGQSVVTSGSYQRFYVVNGKSYHHIINPETLMPSEGFISVSVVTPSSADGDALSTALFCMTLEEGMALVESLSDTEALWVTLDGTRHESSGFAAYKNQT